MRAEAASLAGVDNLKSDVFPFTFPLKDGHCGDKECIPMCFTPSLRKKIGDMLNFNDDTERRFKYSHFIYTCNICINLECTN